MKKITIIILLGIFTISLAGCSKEKESSQLSDAIKFKEEYEELNYHKNENNGKTYRTIEIKENNSFIYKSATDIIEMMEQKETFVVYFGFATCPWCRSVLPSLMQVASDLEIYPIYYVDIKEIRDTMTFDEDGNIITEKKGTRAYYKLLENLDTVLEEYTLTDTAGNEITTGTKRIYAPNIVSIVEGEAVQLTDGISPNQTDGYMELTETMKEESYDKIKCTIECIVDSKKVCSAETKC